MISNRKQIADALKTVCNNIKMERPATKPTLPLVCYAEVTNVHLSSKIDRIEYQIDAYTDNFPDLIELAKAIDDVMESMGWYRTYASPDAVAKIDDNWYQKVLNYVGRIDLVQKSVIKGL